VIHLSLSLMLLQPSDCFNGGQPDPSSTTSFPTSYNGSRNTPTAMPNEVFSERFSNTYMFRKLQRIMEVIGCQSTSWSRTSDEHSEREAALSWGGESRSVCKALRWNIGVVEAVRESSLQFSAAMRQVDEGMQPILVSTPHYPHVYLCTAFIPDFHKKDMI
jgi:hypothetical protein